MFHSAQSSLIDFVWDFRSKGSRSKSVVKIVNLFRISIASSTLFRDGGNIGSSGTLPSSLLPSLTVSISYGRFPLTISSTDNGQGSLVATSLWKSTSPSASRFSGAKSGLASQSWFRSHSNLSTALSSSPSCTIPLNGSSWSCIAPSWAFNEIPDFQQQFRVVCSVISPQAFLSIIMASRIDVSASCLSLSTALVILRTTRDRYLAFNDLR